VTATAHDSPLGTEPNALSTQRAALTCSNQALHATTPL